MSLKLGTDKSSGNDVLLPTDRRFQNTLIFGAIGSGKTRSMLLSMAIEQLQDASSGATFICGRGDESWVLDRMAHRMGRDVLFLNPLSDRGTSDYLETEYSSGYEMQKHLIDYVDAIRNNKIVIVDFDLSNTRKKGKKGLIKILYHLQRAMVHNTEENPHYVYIDDAEFALPYISELITYGKNHSVGTTLFLSSFKLVESRSREVALFLDTYCATTIVLNRLNHEDMTYFNRRFYGKIDSKPFTRRNPNEVVVETVIDEMLEVKTVEIPIPTSRLITELEDDVVKEKERRRNRKRGRPRGVLSDIVETDNDVDQDFDESQLQNRVFLDEDDFFKNL